ncbi:MAG: MoxR family ATPase [SAR324 cluster bacterium]|jgi:MoxR-like ATPase|nr:MoxR family ATPase [SAR324 cluster bacterium]
MNLTQDADNQPTEAVPDPERLHQELLDFSSKFKEAISGVIIGQEAILDQLVVALFCRGHVLITGVPGLAKTLLIRSLAQLFHLQFNRIQCTPDLMPSDITGVEILEESGNDRKFRFISGPVFTNLLLADEINRTSPRTQAALLQAMQEHEVTVSGHTRPLEDPFIVFATQNPIDSEGTYPLPEAQLDRFLFNIDIRYPVESEEIKIAQLPSTFDASPLEPIFEPGLINSFQALVNAVPMGNHLVEWVVRFIRDTRPEQSRFEEIRNLVEWGAGVRASQNIVRAARARAVLDGSTAVRPEHIRAILLPVLRHRLLLNFSAEAEQWTSDRLIEWLIERTPFP